MIRQNQKVPEEKGCHGIPRAQEVQKRHPPKKERGKSSRRLLPSQPELVFILQDTSSLAGGCPAASINPALLHESAGGRIAGGRSLSVSLDAFLFHDPSKWLLLPLSPCRIETGGGELRQQ